MNLETVKTTLLDRRKALSAHLDHVEDALDETPPPDWEDRASERQGDEVLERLGIAELAELRRIDAALARIEEGSYGTCRTCGGTISDARLALLPDTPFCKDCAE